jgi:hypothetical protein
MTSLITELGAANNSDIILSTIVGSTMFHPCILVVQNT